MTVELKFSVKSFVLVLSIIWRISSAAIYNLNDTEYKKLPPVFHVDSYEECMQNPVGVYCETKLVLVSDNNSHLLDLIREYSAHRATHYNHSRVRYSLCFTSTCEEYNNNLTTDPVNSLEACLNKTFLNNYGLKTRILDNVHCRKANEKTEIEVFDKCMFAFLTAILMINIIGSSYDFICTSGRTGEGIRYLTCFAVRRNWRKLVAPALEGQESQLKRLKALSGLKFITTILVIVTHSITTSTMFIDNPKFVEELYSSRIMHFVLNGSIVMQTFFICSGLLLAYNLELMSEKEKFTANWMLFLKGIVLRFLRLTPVYAIMLFFTMTCNKYLVSGPISHYMIMDEIEDCRQYWWQHLLYINNYNNRSQCMLHTWYLASDTQLYCLGLAIYIFCRTTMSRKVVLSILLVVSIAIPVCQTYWQDLDGLLAASPEEASYFYLTNSSFKYLYKPSHTNMFSYLVGIVMGFLAYHGQKINYDVQKLRKYRVFYYALLFLGVAVIMSGSVFFREGPRPSMAVRLLFAAYQKPVWCAIVGTGILGFIFKYEDLIRGIVEWHGWTALSRLSYCAYLLHITVIKLISSINQSLLHVSILTSSERVVHTLLVSYLLSVPLWMMMEQPFRQLMKMFLSPPGKKEPADNSNTAKNLDVDLTSKNDMNTQFEEQLNES